ncbi:MAG TPA: hypothetical protein DCZ88_17775 [Pseudanabaena sp.]|nr:hypothetical protein [Pseudanabaena sp.]
MICLLVLPRGLTSISCSLCCTL